MPKLHSAVGSQCVGRKMNQCLWVYFACVNKEGEQHVLACMSIVVGSYFRNIDIFMILLIHTFDVCICHYWSKNNHIFIM